MLLTGKRLLALLMTMLMIISALPMTVLAEDVVDEPAPVVTEEPVVEEPIVEEPVVEEPVVEPTEEPVVEPTEEPVVEEPVVEPTEEPVVEEPVDELPELEALTIEGNTSMFVGKEYQLIIMRGDVALNPRSVEWSSSDKDIAKVGKKGLVTAKAVGSVVITATDEYGMTAKLTIEVIKDTKYIETSSNKKFSKAVSKNNIEYARAIPKTMAVADEFASMRLIVHVKPGKKINVDEYNPAKVIKNYDNRYVIQFDTVEDAKAAYEYLSSLKKVTAIAPDGIVRLAETEDNGNAEPSAFTYKSWGAKRMGADILNSYTAPSTTVNVAIIDTGISAHSFIGSKRKLGYDYVDRDSNPTDEQGHGTHVAGTVVDLTQGMNVNVVAYRVLDADGYGWDTDITNAIYDAADYGCKVMNLSLGGDYSTTGYNLYYNAISYAVGKGATVCVAAGNDTDNTNYYVPACVDMTGCITVSSIDDDDTDSYFSNYGDSVDLCAPGSYITSCNYLGGFCSKSGTSMATPHIAAAAAATIIWTGNSSPSSVHNKLISIAEDLGAAGDDYLYGYGVPIMSKLYTSNPNPNPGNPSPNPGNPVLSATNVTVGKKQIWQLTVSGNSGPVTWATANSNIATVSPQGLVTAKKKIGSTMIYAYVDGRTLSCKFTVSKPKLNYTDISVVQRLKAELKVNYTDKKVKWKSSNTAIATVNSNGKVTGKKKGTVTITATVDGYTLKCKVNVKENKTSFPVPSPGQLDPGDFYIYAKKVYYSGSKVYMDAYVYNLTGYSVMVKFDYVELLISDHESGFIIADKTFYNVPLNIRHGNRKKVTFKFTGSATNDKSYNFRENEIDVYIGSWMYTYRY